MIQRVGGLRVAGYDDPFVRRAADDYADRYRRLPSVEQQDAFAAFMRSIEDDVDVIMVHEPALIAAALDGPRGRPPTHPIVFVVGHTHMAALDHTRPGVTVINGGSIGAGGTGNLADVADQGRHRPPPLRDRPVQPAGRRHRQHRSELRIRHRASRAAGRVTSGYAGSASARARSSSRGTRRRSNTAAARANTRAASSPRPSAA